MKVQRVAHWAEILANLGVIVTLVLLLLQVRETPRPWRARRSFSGGGVHRPVSLGVSRTWRSAKIKDVDGPEPEVAAYMARYDLTYEEGAVWHRHIVSLWTSLEAEYTVFGDPKSLGSGFGFYCRSRTLRSGSRMAAPTG